MIIEYRDLPPSNEHIIGQNKFNLEVFLLSMNLYFNELRQKITKA